MLSGTLYKNRFLGRSTQKWEDSVRIDLKQKKSQYEELN